MTKKSCYSCMYHTNLSIKVQCVDGWFNQICRANPLPNIIDPKTNIDMGRLWYAFCVNINPDGNCKQYVVK